MQTKNDHTPLIEKARALKNAAMQGPMGIFLKISAGVVVAALLAIIAINLVISTDGVRDRVAARIKEQTGRDLTVNGSTSLLFTPSPHVVITDATLTDPERRAGTADVSIGKLVLDLNFSDLLSHKIDAERVVLVRPMVTLRVGSNSGLERHGDANEAPKPIRFAKAAAGGDDDDTPRREIRLKDVRIEDGTVNIVYDKNGEERRIEHIAAELSLPTIKDPLTATGKFDWKEQTVAFSLELATPADLRDKRPARLQLALDNPAIAARFDGNILTKPSFSGQGELAAKAHSIPSLLAWMREKPTAATAIGDGELVSRLSWNEDEINLTDTRFALEHASGQGQAVVTLKSPRPHVRAAFALDHLDVNPFLPPKPVRTAVEPESTPPAPPVDAPAATQQSAPQDEAAAPPKKEPSEDWFTKPKSARRESEPAPSKPEAAVPPPPQPDTTSPAAEIEVTPPPAAPQTSAIAPSATGAFPVASDADVNLNVRKTRVGHLDIGPSSLGLNFREGVLYATLGGMDLYDGHASGRLVLDASKPVPAFTGDFQLDGVQAKTFLSDAAQFSLLSGRTKLSLKLSGAGGTADEIKSSLQGQGSIAVSDGSIDGIDITGAISSLGEGNIPNFQQVPGAKTNFSDLGGSFVIQNGVAETGNLKVQSPLLKVSAAGNVDLNHNTINILAHPEIVAGPEGKGGANDLAGLTVPVRIEGPLDDPQIRPEIKGVFANPGQTSKTLNQIGEVLQKKFKGRPVGEALGKFLGNVQIGPRGGGEEAEENTGSAGAAPIIKQRSPRQAAPAPQADGPEQGDIDKAPDPDLEEILR